jgi:hypothetical protein
MKKNIVMTVFLYVLVPCIFAQTPDLGAWKNNRLYLGLRAGGGFVPSYFLPFEVMKVYNFHGAFSFTGQITDWFGIQTELMYSHTRTDEVTDSAWFDEAAYGHGSYTTVENKITMPLLARFTFKPKNFSFGANGGVYFGFPLGNRNASGTVTSGTYLETMKAKSPNIGITGGVNFGYHIGPGTLFFDIRALRDLTPIELEGSLSVNGSKLYDIAYSSKRGSLDFSIGYEIGILPKAGK